MSAGSSGTTPHGLPASSPPGAERSAAPDRTDSPGGGAQKKVWTNELVEAENMQSYSLQQPMT